jgi:two-component system invasion response regulator UvrY
MVNILFAVDHVTEHLHFQKILESSIANSFIEHAGNEVAALEKIKGNIYQMMIIGFDPSGLGSAGLVTEILLHRPTARILILARINDNGHARKFLTLGAMGYITNKAEESEIIMATRNILDNKRYISATLLEKLTMDVLEDRRNNPFRQLSQREFEIVKLFLTGGSHGEISAKLSLHPSTVATYKSRIMEKLKCKDLSETAILARTYNIVI